MLNGGCDKRVLFNTTVIAGLTAAMLASTPAWAQVAVPATPTTQVQQPSQPRVQPPQIDEQPGDATQTNADETNALADDLEGVTVTGSRIRRPEYEGNIPGVQVDSEEIERRGFVNAIEILNDVPLVGPGPALGTSTTGPVSTGVSFVDLLDLGTQRTLTLVNGRRFVSGNAGTLFVSGNATGSQVDVNIIPSSLIDRVDVLTVGGAAAYGSDAISGVVNFILKTDYEGAEVSAVYGQTSRGDAENYSVRALVGSNFLNDRGNASIGYEYNFVASLYESDRDFLALDPATATNFRNGSIRNPFFDPRQRATGSNTAFISASSDLVNATTYLRETTTLTSTVGGTVLQLTTGNANNPTTAVNQVGPGAATAVLSNVVQIVPGTPGFGATGVAGAAQTCNPSGTPGVQAPAALPICNFAPTALPTGVTAAQVFTAFRVTPPAGLTTAEQNALAVNILQANRQTPREFFAANPNTPINAFLGTFVPALPDIANPDPATNRFLPRLAVPLVFNNQGNVEEVTLATLTPDQPGTIGAAPGGQGNRTRDLSAVRIEQERQIGSLFGNFEILPNVRLFTENVIAEVKTVNPRESAAGASNSAASNTTESAALIVNVNNPFLDDADRAALARVGISGTVNRGNFILSRTNQDIFGDAPVFSDTRTFRTSNGVSGDASMFGRDFNWEASLTYGKVEQETRRQVVADVEYALALDAVRAPNGEIVCRAKLTPGIVGTTPPGIQNNAIFQPGADGIPTAVNFTPTVTQAQVDACVPLNPFGVNQMSEAAKNFVKADNVFNNESKQTVTQGFVSGDLFDLPAGAVGFSVAGEYRIETISFRSDEINRLGRARLAAYAQTEAETRTWEAGAEFLIPVFGGDFRLPGFYSFDISPAIRFSKQEGEAPPFRDLNGNVFTPESKGDLARIYALAFTWRPIEDITLRGNKSRSIRQPSATELFLGPQPSFTNPTDPCSNSQIGAGSRPDVRRRNCITDVIRLGLAADTAGAESFLNSYVASNISRQGTFAGSPDLSPEIADSYTLGVLVQPRFIPRLRASVDYVDVALKNQVFNAGLTSQVQFCYDSASFPNNSAQVGVNTCSNFTRRATDFGIDNGYRTGFINLSATVVKGYSIRGDYRFEIADALNYVGLPIQSDMGELSFRFTAYNLEDFITSAEGTFTDASISTGSITAARPEWETQLTTVYSRGPLDVGLTWEWISGQQLFTSGQLSTAENFPQLSFEGVHTFNGTIGYELLDRYRLQFTVNNILDTNFYSPNGELYGPTIGYVSTFGRAYRVSLRATF